MWSGGQPTLGGHFYHKATESACWTLALHFTTSLLDLCHYFRLFEVQVVDKESTKRAYLGGRGLDLSSTATRHFQQISLVTPFSDSSLHRYSWDIHVAEFGSDKTCAIFMCKCFSILIHTYSFIKTKASGNRIFKNGRTKHCTISPV